MTPVELAVLVVEDNPGDLRLIEARLAQSRRVRYLCVAAGSARLARELLERQRFDAVVIDLSLPDSRGLDAVRAVSERAPGTAVVVLTGLDSEDEGVAAVQAGAQDYLIKSEALSTHVLSRSISQAIERKRIEAELRSAHERLVFAERMAHLGSWEHDFRTGVDEWSEETYRILGLRPGEAKPSLEAYLERVHPEDRARILEGSKRMDAQELAREKKTRVVWPDGTVRVTLDRMELETSPDGKPVRLRGSMLDITELNEAQRALQTSERQYRLLFEENPSPMWVLDSESLRVLAVNTAACAEYGYSHDEFMQLEAHALRAPSSPSDPDAIRRKLVRGRETFDTRHRRKDGTEMDMVVTGGPIVFNGRPAILAKARNVTREREALAKVKASEAQYRRLFNGVADALLVIDLERAVIVDCNDVAIKMYGYWRDELVGMPSERIAGQPETHGPILETLKKRGRLILTERVHRRKDGSIFLAEVSISVVELDGRRVALAATRDITALVETRDRFRRMAESISQVFWMTDLAKNTMVYISPGYEKIWGRSCESLYKNPMTWIEAIVPEDRDRVRVALGKQTSGTYDEVYRIRRPDGSVRWVRDRAFPVRDAFGKITLVTGVAEDVTEQRRAAAALDTSRAVLEAAEDVALIGSYSSDPREAGAPLSWSAGCYKIFGLPVGRRMLLEDFWRMVHSEDAARARQAVEAASREGGEYYDQFRIVRPDGEVRWVQTRARYAADESGQGGRLIGVVQDVTEQVRSGERLSAVEQQLRQAQKMEAIGRLAGGVAHDFNNLLTAILGMSDLSLGALPRSHPVAKDLTDIRETALRAAALTQQLLAFSRRQFVEPRLLDLSGVVEGSSKMLRRLIGEDVQLSVVSDGRKLVVKADPTQVEQLLVNLAVNARDAMPSGGQLTISSRLAEVDTPTAQREGLPGPGSYAMLAVADTGSGMTEEVKAHLFEPFYTTKGPGKGTGLGLATCYGIAKQSGGSISCVSTEGAGTTFRVCLPLAAAASPAAVRRSKGGRAPGGKETVLIVEDEVPVRRLLVRALKELGYSTLEAEDGQAGLEAVRGDSGRRIQLVITDTVMPRMGGKKLADAVGAERPDIKVLFTSGYTDDVIVREGIESSSIPFLRKPFTPRALASKVREVLGPRRLKRRVRAA